MIRPVDEQERAAAREERIGQVVGRLGQDRQRLDRVGGRHTYLVFPDRATADEVMQEIAATPTLADGLAWPVQIWDEDAGAGIGSFAAADGRVAVGHPWTRAERGWLAEYVAGWRAVEILDALPADWKPREAGEPARR